MNKKIHAKQKKKFQSIAQTFLVEFLFSCVIATNKRLYQELCGITSHRIYLVLRLIQGIRRGPHTSRPRKIALNRMRAESGTNQTYEQNKQFQLRAAE